MGEALSTYESLLQAQQDGSYGTSATATAITAAAEVGIAQALRGLGAQHALANYASIIAQQRMPELRTVQREVASIASETAWRLADRGKRLEPPQYALLSKHSDSTSARALAEWHPVLGTSADQDEGYSQSMGRARSISPFLINANGVSQACTALSATAAAAAMAAASAHSLQGLLGNLSQEGNTIGAGSRGRAGVSSSSALSSFGGGIASESLNASIAAALSSLQDGRYQTCRRLTRTASINLFPEIIMKMREETAANVIHNFSEARKLLEISEACLALQRSSGARNSDASSLASGGNSDENAVVAAVTAVADGIMLRWAGRCGISTSLPGCGDASAGSSGAQQQQQHAGSNAALSESQAAVRCALLRSMVQHRCVSALDAVEAMAPLQSLAVNASSAHTITPLAYQFWRSISMSSQRSSLSSGGNSIKKEGADSRRKVAGQPYGPNGALMEALDDALVSARWSLQECSLLWKKNLKDAAITNLNSNVLTVLENALTSYPSSGGSNAPVSTALSFRIKATCNALQDLYSESLRTGGEWLGTKRSASATGVIEDYLHPAADCAVSTTQRVKTCATLAAFNARLFESLRSKVHSAEWRQGGRVLKDRKEEYEECFMIYKAIDAGKAVPQQAPDDPPITKAPLVRHINTLKKEIEIDSKERDAVELSVAHHLEAAVRELGKVLLLSTEPDVDTVFRLVQLWLGNYSSHPVINESLSEITSNVASYKFIPLTYQLLSRLGDSQVPETDSLDDSHGGTADNKNIKAPASAVTTAYQTVLQQLVYRLCSEHPFHTLPQLFALAHEREMTGTYDGAAQFQSNVAAERVDAANAIVAQLKSAGAGVGPEAKTGAVHSSSRHQYNQKQLQQQEYVKQWDQQKLVESTQNLLLAYINLAKASTEQCQIVGHTKGIKFKEIQARGKRFPEAIAALSVMPVVLTVSVRLSRFSDYHDAPRIRSFEETFSITDNGISRPKIITCYGTDGRSYTQLVKGGDDMRQDAVMEQVFESVNYTLGRDEETRKRNLRIRTYKIIPTTPQTGVLEWVDNTATFGTILCAQHDGAHSRYYPHDWTHAQCRNHLVSANSNEQKIARFQEICDKFHPAFRFFFLERFADPSLWLSRRLTYTRSVAANSIIGYILGIGDRHAFNILIDTTTAEAVHIDFGIVFEQGKGLRTPETVPFRLTRDIIDGMGISGCEGSFRRSCEEVLRVLRAHAPQILTILEVVIYDPLYKWNLSPLQARMKQSTVPDFHDQLTHAQQQQQKGAHGGGKRSKGRSAAQAHHQQNVTFAASATGGGGGGGGGADTAMGGVGTTTIKTAGGGGRFGKDAAERTLARIRRKLQGYEDLTAGEALDVDGQVDSLINEARNAHNLSRLFAGWAPWL